MSTSFRLCREESTSRLLFLRPTAFSNATDSDDRLLEHRLIWKLLTQATDHLTADKLHTSVAPNIMYLSFACHAPSTKTHCARSQQTLVFETSHRADRKRNLNESQNNRCIVCCARLRSYCMRHSPSAASLAEFVRV